MQTDSIIIRPLITERSMNDAGKRKFTFLVARVADKTAIKKAVEEAFKVNVIAVATSLVKGKTKRIGVRRSEIKVTPYKKAIVELKKGQKIDIFEIGG